MQAQKILLWAERAYPSSCYLWQKAGRQGVGIAIAAAGNLGLARRIAHLSPHAKKKRLGLK